MLRFLTAVDFHNNCHFSCQPKTNPWLLTSPIPKTEGGLFMEETHEKDRNQKQPNQTKQQASRPGLKTASQENKDSPSSDQRTGNPEK